jgi:hypothetical protein
MYVIVGVQKIGPEQVEARLGSPMSGYARLRPPKREKRGRTNLQLLAPRCTNVHKKYFSRIPRFGVPPSGGSGFVVSSLRADSRPFADFIRPEDLGGARRSHEDLKNVKTNLDQSRVISTNLDRKMRRASHFPVRMIMTRYE